jgi:hypothetical protein
MRDMSGVLIHSVQEVTTLMNGMGLPPFTKDMLAHVVGMCRLVLLDKIVSLNF